MSLITLSIYPNYSYSLISRAGFHVTATCNTSLSATFRALRQGFDLGPALRIKQIDALGP